MGRDSKIHKKHSEEKTEDSSSPSISSDSESSPRSKRSSSRRHKGSSTSRRDKEKKREREERHRRRRKERREKKRERRREEKRRSKKRAEVDSDDDDSKSSGGDESEPEVPREDPEIVLRYILKEFPYVADDLKQLLQVIDDGQAVDTSGMSNRSLVKLLKKLFVSLNLKENGTGLFLLPTTQRPTLEVVGSIITSHLRPTEQQFSNSASTAMGTQSPQLVVNEESPAPRRSLIGPEMPSSELLAAAAKLTEAEAVLRDAELEDDTGLFIGPPPPAVVAEAASANEAERFEEVTRIMAAEDDTPYDVLGVNLNMSTDNMKKRYWKLSLLVHPDKCSHPQAQQAFVKLNRAFKDLQDTDKRKVIDDKIRLKEEQEAFKVELKARREAAQWRRLQGISMPGDDELLEVTILPQKREEWMTTLPPERKPGMTMHSTTSFSKTTKEGRGDTSVWTQTPMDRAQQAKMNYLEAYNKAAALASNEEEKKRKSSDADLVDKYNQAKRSKSLVQKHQEEAASSRSKKKIKQQTDKEEWVGKHPWKPWDRENDLTAGRQKVNLDSESMMQGLSSRFSSGTVQRNFL
ncbi:uncharacterized protein LOC122640299 [Telopea speciosissima]|uniref:uncharacterized protein LOC122640299 n=1 Tax=Telopea speciosissima TaxID=54955 RepID=UPI001CC54BBA|nr:uncharacterized protein LOC122640299 [Telopea speciosissima]